MRTPFRAITLTAGLAVAAIALSGCGLLPAHKASDSTSLTDSVSSVRIDGNNADITIEGVAGATGINIEREFVYWGSKREFGATYEVSGSELVLSGCGDRCMVSYTVEVPEGVNVSGRTDNGSIELSGVKNVDVATNNGRIELDEITGKVDVTTSNGRIEGDELSGTGIVAETSNGSIELELATPQSLKATTSNGAVRVRVPETTATGARASYEVVAETSNGSKNINIASDPNGSYLLDLETSNGSIVVDWNSAPRD